MEIISIHNRIKKRERERARAREIIRFVCQYKKKTHQLFVKSAQSNHRVVIHHNKRFNHLSLFSMLLLCALIFSYFLFCRQLGKFRDFTLLCKRERERGWEEGTVFSLLR